MITALIFESAPFTDSMHQNRARSVKAWKQLYRYRVRIFSLYIANYGGKKFDELFPGLLENFDELFTFVLSLVNRNELQITKTTILGS